jgi:gamma-glutamyl-gamma-aminobutyrate hydrolase PuuD
MLNQFNTQTYEELCKLNNLNQTDRPIVAICPDWRVVKNAETNEEKQVYISALMRMHLNIIQKYNCAVHVMGFYDTASSLENKIHGWYLPGGRDIDPKNYG